jgi:hypothetical protein
LTYALSRADFITAPELLFQFFICFHPSTLLLSLNFSM